jgi:RecB family exonuclease
MGIIMKWSYSSIKLFQQCPRKYYHLRVLKDIVEPESEAMRYGTLVHKAAEDYIVLDQKIPMKFSFIKPVLDVLKEMPGNMYCEYKMGITAELKPCEFFDDDVWFRGVTDLLIINDDIAHVIDYKTGKSAKYADVEQLELMALAVFKHFPEVKKVKAGLAFLVANDFVRASYKQETEGQVWLKWLQETDRLEAAHNNDVWNAKPNFTCKNYCPVKDCQHNGKGHWK